MIAWVAATIFANASALSPNDWALTLLRSTRESPALQQHLRRARALRLLAESERELLPWALEVGGDHTLMAENRADPLVLSPKGITEIDAGTSKYLGGGADLSLVITGTRNAYRPSDAFSTDSAFTFMTELRLGIDLLRDFLGRYQHSQRDVDEATALSAAYDALYAAELRALAILQAAIDYCVFEDQQAAYEATLAAVEQLLKTLEVKERANIVAASDLLQFQSLVMTLQRELTETKDNHVAAGQRLAATYGLTAVACPTLGVDALAPDPTVPQVNDRAPQLLAAELKIRQRESERVVAELAQWPSLTPFAGAVGRKTGNTLSDATGSYFKEGEHWGGVIGADFAWTLGDGRGALAKQAASANLRAEREQAQDVHNALTSTLQALTTRRRSIASLLTGLANQEKVIGSYLEIQRTRYELGRSRAFELSSAYRDELDTKLLRAPLCAEWYKAEWQDHAVNGRLLAQVEDKSYGGP